MEITEEIQEITSLKVSNLLKKLDLQQSTTPQSFTGSKPLAENTLRAYRKHLKGMENFCMFIGDYESLLILLEKPPEPFCPAMNPLTICHYIHFKRWPKDTPLRNIITNELVLDIFGNSIVCQGKWKDPKNVDQLISAIGAIHAAKGHRECFFDSCKDCIDDGNLGCRFHRGNPLFWKKGNPKNCDLLENIINKNSKDGSSYVSHGDSPITPWELIDIREHLINSNNLYDLQIITMILVSVKLFLREDEVSSLRIESFIQDLFVVTPEGYIEGLAVSVQGKSDQKPVTLMLWADNDIPNLCPIRHLLVYLYESKICSGFIFPARKRTGSL